MNDKLINFIGMLEQMKISAYFAFSFDGENVCEQASAKYELAIQENAEILIEAKLGLDRSVIELLLKRFWRNEMPVAVEDGGYDIMRIPSRLWYPYMAGILDAYVERSKELSK